MKVKVKPSTSVGGRADGTKYEGSANEGFSVPEEQQEASAPPPTIPAILD